MKVATAACCLAFSVLLLGSRPAEAFNLFGWGNPAPMQTMDSGHVAAAEAAAAVPQNQQIASKVFCYCGCDREHGHQSLLDCKTTGHIPVCKTCQSEFIRVGQLNAQHMNVAQIQNEIDREFAHTYPFPSPSPILKRYEASKLSPGMM